MSALGEIKPLISNLRKALQAFSASTSSFRVLTTTSTSLAYHVPIQTLYILDSSFNPPTLAHLGIAVSALLNDKNANSSPTKRLLLLLATQNADKAPKPASFEERLAMMTIFADELLQKMKATNTVQHDGGSETVVVDVGVTKSPLYLDKAAVLEQSGHYGDVNNGPEQVHLTGFDSLIRLLDPKYYPPDHTLHPLQSLFSKHRVRATRRTDDKWGGVEEQDAYVEALAYGSSKLKGFKHEWSSRIELVDGTGTGEEIISSTKVREASKSKDKEALRQLVPEGIVDFILEEELYT